jgi:hypothetical protein
MHNHYVFLIFSFVFTACIVLPLRTSLGKKQGMQSRLRPASNHCKGIHEGENGGSASELEVG